MTSGNETTFINLLEILVPSILALAALITALANRRMPKNDAKRTETEAFSAQLNATKTLAESSKELVGISQALINRIETELSEITQQNKEMEMQVQALRMESETLKESIESLKIENSRMVAISKQLINGIGVLLVQLRSMDILPQWTPTQELIDTIDRRKDPSTTK